jgi:hypothetical protein
VPWCEGFGRPNPSLGPQIKSNFGGKLKSGNVMGDRRSITTRRGGRARPDVLERVLEVEAPVERGAVEDRLILTLVLGPTLRRVLERRRKKPVQDPPGGAAGGGGAPPPA